MEFNGNKDDGLYFKFLPFVVQRQLQPCVAFLCFCSGEKVRQLKTTFWLLLLLGLQAVAPLVSAEEDTETASLLKAVFIYNFAKFTTWPESSWTGSEAPMTLCTLGSDEVVAALGNLSDRRVKGHVVIVRTMGSSATDTDGGCHLLYIARSEEGRYVGLLKAYRGRALLTVSELPEFARTGGMVQLHHEDGRIRFTINLQAARKAGLEISSRLLSLANLIDEKEQP